MTIEITKTIDIDVDLEDFDLEDIIDYIETRGYWIRKGNNKLEVLEDYIRNNKLNDIQIDELLDKILL